MKRWVWLFLFLVLVSLVSAVDYPLYQGYVNDYAEIISPEYESQIESLAGQIEAETTAEIAVLTVDDFQGLDRETYAVEVFEEWGIGKKDVDNGLLILVGLEEREWRIEVGYGLEPLITDAAAGRIGRNRMVPNFQNGEFGKGIYEAVLDIGGYIEGEEEIVSQYNADNGFELSGSGYFYVAILIALIVGSITGVATRKIENKKARWGVRLGIAAAIFIALIFWSAVLAVMFLIFYIFVVGGRGGGFLFLGPGFRGGGGSGGFGGFGGGMSGGGGAGGRF